MLAILLPVEHCQAASDRSLEVGSTCARSEWRICVRTDNDFLLGNDD